MDEVTIQKGMEALSLIDEDITHAFSELGCPPPRSRPPGFETFISTIVSQQLSTKVAAVIMARVTELLKEVTPQRLLNIEEQALRDAGLSWRKIEYAKGLANAVVDGSFNIDALDDLSDEDAINEIIKMKGFGRWSAEIYLMFSLDREDIFPADDLGILVALGRLKGLPNKPTPKQARTLVAHWAPLRSIGTLFLWQYYHHPISE